MAKTLDWMTPEMFTRRLQRVHAVRRVRESRSVAVYCHTGFSEEHGPAIYPMFSYARALHLSQDLGRDWCVVRSFQ